MCHRGNSEYMYIETELKNYTNYFRSVSVDVLIVLVKQLHKLFFSHQLPSPNVKVRVDFPWTVTVVQNISTFCVWQMFIFIGARLMLLELRVFSNLQFI